MIRPLISISLVTGQEGDTSGLRTGRSRPPRSAALPLSRGHRSPWTPTASHLLDTALSVSTCIRWRSAKGQDLKKKKQRHSLPSKQLLI